MLKTRWILGLTIALALAAHAQFPLPADEKSRSELAAKLVTALKSDATLDQKQAACRQLAVIGDKSVVPVLASLLADDKLSHMARYALEPIPDPSVDDALRDAAGKLKGKLLVGVINSIGVRRDAKAVDLLAKFLGDADPDTFGAAATSLGKIGDDAAAKSLEAAFKSATVANKGVLGDGCVRCADVLTAAGKNDAAVALYDLVRASDAPRHVVMAAARGAIIARGPAGVSLFAELLAGDDPAMSAVALRIAHEVPGKAVNDALVAELAKGNPAKQVVILQTLGDRKDPSVLAPIIGATKAADAKVRQTAVRVLAQVGDASCIPMLVEMATGADAELAKAASLTLATLSGKDVNAAIVALLDSPDPKIRPLAMDIVSQRRIAAAMPAMVKSLAADTEPTRIVAIKFVGDLGGVNEIPAMLAALTSAKSPNDLSAAEAAITAMASRTPEGGADKLIAALPQAGNAQKCAILRAIRSCPNAKSLAAVREALKDSAADVQEAATRVICDWITTDAAPDMLNLAKAAANTNTKVLALRGYLRLAGDGSLAADKKLAMCKEAAALVERNEEKRSLLGALGQLSNADALAMTLPHLENQAIRDEAGAAAVTIAERIIINNKPAVADAMPKVLAAAQNKDVLKRAQSLLDRAKK